MNSPELDHVAIVVPDLDTAKDFAANVLGLRFDREFEVELIKRKVAFYWSGAVRIEFIEDLDPARKQAVLGGRQAVIEHLALKVGDIDQKLGELGAAGVRLDALGLVELGGRRTGYTDPQTTQGVIYQLLGT